MSIASRIRAYASLGLIGAGKALAGTRYGDGWNGLAAIPARTVLDIGACGGELAERELLATFPNAQVHCFEPHPVSFARLEKVAGKHRRMHINDDEVSAWFKMRCCVCIEFTQLFEVTTHEHRNSKRKPIGQCWKMSFEH